MNVETIDGLFLFELRRAYSIENRLADELETLERDVAVDSLDGLQLSEPRTTVEDLIAEKRAVTADQKDRLEDVLEAFGRRPTDHSTPAIDGLVAEKEQFNNVVLNDEIRPLYYVGMLQEVVGIQTALYERLLRLASQLDVSEGARTALERNHEETVAVGESLRSVADGDDVESLTEAIVERSEFP